MADKVWVVIHKHDYEGHGEPLRVFAEKALADLFIAGSEAGYGSGLTAYELDLITLASLKGNGGSVSDC